jgi:hypothetical protein
MTGLISGVLGIVFGGIWYHWRGDIIYSKEMPCPTSHVKYYEPLLFSSSH